MTSISKLLVARISLAAAFVACACQHDAGALFDDAKVPSQGSGGALPVAGSQATGGGAGADTSEGNAGEAGGGSAGSSSEGGTAGTDGSGAGTAGKPGAGEGGTAGSAAGSAGSGGTKPDPDPEPVTITITEFDDAHVASCLPTLNFGSEVTFNVDADGGCVYQALVKPSLATLPQGALVSEATLTLHCVNMGDDLAISYAAQAWAEGEVSWLSRPELGASIGELECQQTGAISLDLTAVVVAWASGGKPAHGLYLRTEDSDGTDFASSEATDVTTRPVLTVTYELPAK